MPSQHRPAWLSRDDGQGYSKLDYDLDAKSLPCIITLGNAQQFPPTPGGIQVPAGGSPQRFGSPKPISSLSSAESPTDSTLPEPASRALTIL